MSGRSIAAVVAALIVGMVLSRYLPRLRYKPPGRNSTAAAPQRVICMSPAVTEMAFALGQAERVVGVSQFTTYPPEAAEKPQCGGFANPAFERILSLHPDLVITQGMGRKVREFCEERDIACLSVELTDLESIFAALDEISRALACEERAQELVGSMRDSLGAVRRKAEAHPRRKVFLVIGREPGTLRQLHTVGPGSFLNDVLKLAGGDNVFGDLSLPYATVSKESLVERQPDVIIELHGEGMTDEVRTERITQVWSAMSVLPAVRQRRVHAIGSTYALMPSPRVVLLAEEFYGILHGGAEE